MLSSLQDHGLESSCLCKMSSSYGKGKRGVRKQGQLQHGNRLCYSCSHFIGQRKSPDQAQHQYNSKIQSSPRKWRGHWFWWIVTQITTVNHQWSSWSTEMICTIIKSLTAEREVGGLCEILKIVAERAMDGHSKLFYEIELNWDFSFEFSSL